LEDYSKIKILTIDDEVCIRQSIRTFLEDYGFVVLEAENGKTGLDLFYKELPDLVLLDLRMPEMGGLEVLETLNGNFPEIPVVVASGTGNIDSLVQALHLGARDYVLKPILDMEVLYHSVTKCVKESRIKKENKAYQERLEELVKERTCALEQSEQQYKAVFEYTGTATIILESDGTISMANSRFVLLAGMDRHDIQGKKKWTEFIAPRDVTALKNVIQPGDGMHVFSGSPVQYECNFLDKAGRQKHVYVSLGKILGTDRQVMSLLDVTENKKAEKRWQGLENQLRKSQKMEAIATLAGGIAHDLNNILSPILGYADMIMRSADPCDSVYRRSEKIRKAALRAADLVSQVLFFNRGESEKKHIFQLHPLIGEVVKLLQGSIPSTIQIIDQVDKNCGSVRADPSQIHQVLMNLCTNAYHAMEKTGGRLTVGLRQKMLTFADMIEYPNLPRGPGDYLVIEVSDTGCGMTKDILDRIFDPYFTTKEDGKGTGLGLAMAYSIVQSLHGDILVNSRPKKGSSFSVILPAAADQVYIQEDDVCRTQSLEGCGERLLLVDDEPDVVDMWQEGLAFLGYEPKAFTSSQKALDYFKTCHDQVDLVVTDQTMPEKTGVELAKQMIAIKKDLPIILCSGYAGPATRQMVADAGIRKFIMKPVTVDVLSGEIQKMLV
jgi:PAS domain S-box-containing protein